jgi:hypothetical protein|tara:strand:- start:162 stop:332 length:171 start_codon:yes stop_codon:yes gene_type:complete
MDKKFSVTFLLGVDREANFLSSLDAAHRDDVYDIIKDIFYDVDDVKVYNLIVKERV